MNLNFEMFRPADVKGVPTVLMHGWANSIETTRPFAQQLAHYGQIFAVDLPGHGKTAVPQEPWGMNEFAQALKMFLDQHQLAKVNLIGHSLGGKTAIKFSALYPERVEKIVLIGASGLRAQPNLKKRIRNEFLKFLRLFLRFKNTSLGLKLYREWYIPRFASRDYLNAGAMTKTFVKIVNEELPQELSAIRAPALLLWGEHDDESPVSVAHEMARLISNSRLIVIPNQGHHPFLGTSSSLVVKYVRDFLWIDT